MNTKAEVPAIACPTACDDDCDAPCHEGHEVPYRRQHDVDECEARRS